MKTKYSLITALAIAAVILVVGVGAAYAQTSAPAAQTAQDNQNPRTLTVSGTGKVYTTPDIAYITIGVHTEGKEAATAVSENNQQANEVMDALKSMGVDAKDIQTTNFSIYPRQEYDTDGKPTGEITYAVDNSVFVTIRDLTMVGDVLDEAVKAGANQISGIQFDVANRTAAQSEARKAAVADARAKAEELAAASGVKLGAVQTISEYTSGGPAPMYDMRAMAASESAVPIEAGQMALTIEVNIVYLIQ